MKQLYIFICLFLINCSYADTISDRAARAILENDKILLTFKEGEKNFMVTSHFPLKPDILARALRPNNEAFDLRELQEEQCREAVKTIPWQMRYRGTIGMAVGIALGATAVYSLPQDKSTNTNS